MEEYKTIKVKTPSYDNYLNYLREYHCINCYNFCGEEHDYNSRVCERCVSHATDFKYIDAGNELKDKYLSYMKMLKDESDHDEADNLLCDLLEELGYTEIVEMYGKLPKWYF